MQLQGLKKLIRLIGLIGFIKFTKLIRLAGNNNHPPLYLRMPFGILGKVYPSFSKRRGKGWRETITTPHFTFGCLPAFSAKCTPYFDRLSTGLKFFEFKEGNINIVFNNPVIQYSNIPIFQ